MAEYIEREAAVEKITAYCELRQAICGENDEFLRGLKVALKAIECSDVIPSADVKLAKRGRWEKNNQIFYRTCSICGVKVDIAYANSSKYCPNCGADMRGEGNG